MRETEEVEGARLLPLPLRMSPLRPVQIPPASPSPAQRQAVLGKPLRQDVHHLFRVLSVLEAQNGIIGESDLVRVPFQPGIHHFLVPFVKDVVQVDVGQEWTDRLPLSRTCFAH